MLEKERQESNAESLFFWSYSQSKRLQEGLYCRLLLNHCESYFSQFAFDLIALLKGTYHPGFISSLYGFGTNPGENGRTVSIRYHNVEDYKKWEESNRQYIDTWINSLNGKEKWDFSIISSAFTPLHTQAIWTPLTPSFKPSSTPSPISSPWNSISIWPRWSFQNELC